MTFAALADPTRRAILTRLANGSATVNELAAQHFEGGGHRNAAGGCSSAPLPDVIARFERLLPAFLEAHSE